MPFALHANPPPNSRITVDTDRDGHVCLTLPKPRGGVARYGTSAFLIFWLCGWAFGWVAAFRDVASGAKNGGLFEVFWLCGWTVGGGFVIWTLFRMLRPVIPETFVFARPNLIHDTGIQPPPLSFGYYQRANTWKKMFQKRKRIEFTPTEIETLKLRDSDNDNRLTIDHANDRIDLGRTLTEVEREWLFELIRGEYGLRQ